MSEPFKLPPHPRTNLVNPFQGGKNPFADDEPASDTAPSSPYSTNVATAQSFTPVSDTYSYPTRGGLLVLLGLTSVLCALLSSVAIIGEWTDGIFGTLLIAPILLSLVLGGAACVLARNDRRAILASAMDPAAANAVSLGNILGTVAVIVAIVVIGFLVAETIGVW